jgi:adenosylcobinamide kinase/adenosylcobinamide-phosphate guanylyltransferase
VGQITFFLGGAKSGKTRAALRAALDFEPPRFYLATAQALDGEMARRISNHQAERGSDWRTIEEPLDLTLGLAQAEPQAVVLLDCLTLWMSNRLGLRPDDFNPDHCLAALEGFLAAAERRDGPVIIVSSEVGGGLVPMDEMSRFFRDLSGLAHQLIARRAQSVFLVTAGLALKLK